ncbi:hypothetical protein KM043_010998 [Ampulex compressa]|nr:hypothetical protein KM043_010998 [Ampulex compressa]
MRDRRGRDAEGAKGNPEASKKDVAEVYRGRRSDLARDAIHISWHCAVIQFADGVFTLDSAARIFTAHERDVIRASTTPSGNVLWVVLPSESCWPGPRFSCRNKGLGL